jgi:hypothetical protein
MYELHSKPKELKINTWTVTHKQTNINTKNKAHIHMLTNKQTHKKRKEKNKQRKKTYIEKLKVKSRHAFAWKAPPTYKEAKKGRSTIKRSMAQGVGVNYHTYMKKSNLFVLFVCHIEFS